MSEVDDQGRISIPRMDVAVDVGRVIHPERVRAQFEGAAVFGASLALMGEITAAQGRIRQSNFDDYPVARISEAPYETHVHIVPSEGSADRGGRTGSPPHRAGDLQRPVRHNRQAHSPAADQEHQLATIAERIRTEVNEW